MAQAPPHAADAGRDGTPVLLETFDRMWSASEPSPCRSPHRNPCHAGAEEHRPLEEAALAGAAAVLLVQHLT